ncbi:MAG: hypothetical protein AAGN66_04985 [Acidobacteriota bacterium]
MSVPTDLVSWVAAGLEDRTSMNLAQSRGTVRLALRQSGLDPRAVTVPEMEVVLRRVMPRELEIRAIADGDSICRDLASGLGAANVDTPAPGRTSHADSVFRRIFS